MSDKRQKMMAYEYAIVHEFLGKGESIRAVANRLAVPPSTVSRMLKREREKAALDGSGAT